MSSTRNKVIANNHDVFLAHYREDWEKNLMEPEGCIPLNLEGMERADLVLAFPGVPASGGVHIEMG